LPTYEYACTACGHRLEAVQKFTDAALTVCPDCGGDLRKVYAPVGIVLKGSGFYKTDSRSNGNGNGKKAAQSSESSSGDSSGDSSSDSGAKTESTKSTSTDAGPKSDAGSSKDSAKPAATTSS
jgi:putative FmdB family regulatory protein